MVSTLEASVFHDHNSPLTPESEMRMVHFGLTHYKKRGRPSHYNTQENPPTNELKNKREKIPLHALNLAGTIISYFIKESVLSLVEVEILHKVYLLRKRYLRTIGLRMETKSHLHRLFMPKTASTQRIHLFEDRALEECWRQLAFALNKRNRDIIPTLDTLFAIHPYEDLQQAYTQFIKRRRMDFSQLLNDCKDAWSQLHGG